MTMVTMPVMNLVMLMKPRVGMILVRPAAVMKAHPLAARVLRESNASTRSQNLWGIGQPETGSRND